MVSYLWLHECVISGCKQKDELCMKTADIDLVQSSFAAIYARKAELAERFYFHLFAQAPDVEHLFGRNFSKQKEMFASMLTYCIKGLADEENFRLVGRGLEKAHAGLNLGEREFTFARSALLVSLHDVMGEDLSREQSDAWTRAISQVMQMMDARQPS